MLDAAARAAGLGRADADDPALRAPAAHLHAGAAHAQGRLRAVPRLQGDIAGTTHRHHLQMPYSIYRLPLRYFKVIVKTIPQVKPVH